MMQFLFQVILNKYRELKSALVWKADPCEGGNDQFRYFKMVAIDVLASKTLFLIHLHNCTTKMVSKHVANNYLLSQYVQAILKLLQQKIQIQIQVGKVVFISTSYTREIT